LRFICPSCGHLFRYKRGRVKNPHIREVNEWLTRARCCDCGQHINAKLASDNDRGRIERARKNNIKTSINCVPIKTALE
jgi:C4-type Zn-finger protein